MTQKVAATNDGKGITGHVVAMMVSIGGVQEYRVRYWHNGEIKSEWLYEYELRPEPE